MDQINHIGRPCDSELRFCGAAQRFLDTTALGRTSWAGLADARHRSSPLSSGLGEQMAAARTEATSPPVSPKPPSAWRRAVGGIMAGRDRGGWERMVRAHGCIRVVRAQARSHTAGQGWLGLARPGSALALRLDLRGVVLDSGLGMQTQWRSQTVVQYGGMSEVYLAPFLTECVCE